MWPILFGFLLLEQKENETEAIAIPFLLPIPKEFQTSKNKQISKPAVFFSMTLVNTLFYSSWETIPPLELPESNNELHDNNNFPGSHLWPILCRLLLL